MKTGLESRHFVGSIEVRREDAVRCGRFFSPSFPSSSSSCYENIKYETRYAVWKRRGRMTVVDEARLPFVEGVSSLFFPNTCPFKGCLSREVFLGFSWNLLLIILLKMSFNTRRMDWVSSFCLHSCHLTLHSWHTWAANVVLKLTLNLLLWFKGSSEERLYFVVSYQRFWILQKIIKSLPFISRPFFFQEN